MAKACTNADVSGGLSFDPRTKMLLVVTVSTVVIGEGNGGVMNFVKPALTPVSYTHLQLRVTAWHEVGQKGEA